MLNKQYVPHDLPIYPIRYLSTKDKSDRGFIIRMMRNIPECDQQRVSDEYENLFLSGQKDARDCANKYLLSTAEGCRNATQSNKTK